LSLPYFVDLIPLPLLPRKKGCKRLILLDLALLLRGRGWGEVGKAERGLGVSS